MSCIRDGKVCTKCCEVIHLPIKRRDYLENYKGHLETSDTGFVRKNFKPMKQRLAKKKNPYLFRNGNKEVRHMTFWKCINLTVNGCGIYNERTNLCKGYPFYGEHPVVVQMRSVYADYTPSCTEFYKIPIVMVE